MVVNDPLSLHEKLINMERLMNILHLPKHIRVVVLYIIIGGLWVLIADYAIIQFTQDPERIIKLKQYRGFVFIAIISDSGSNNQNGY